MKRKYAILGVVLIGLGIAFLGLASFPLEARTQIMHEEGPFSSSVLTIFLEKGQVLRAELVVEPSDLGGHYALRVTQVENQRMLFEQGGPIDSLIVFIGFPVEETGHYELNWFSLHVSRITAYRVDNVFPQYIVSAVGGLVLILGTLVCLTGLDWRKMGEAKKERIFWQGLVLSGLAFISLFAVVWYTFVFPVFSWQYSTPWAVGSVAFLLIGFYMTRSGMEKQ
jgi:multisubunit Na+/H+ antiporter MnhB subunit